MCQATYTFAKKEAMICGFWQSSAGGYGADTSNAPREAGL